MDDGRTDDGEKDGRRTPDARVPIVALLCATAWQKKKKKKSLTVPMVLNTAQREIVLIYWVGFFQIGE